MSGPGRRRGGAALREAARALAAAAGVAGATTRSGRGAGADAALARVVRAASDHAIFLVDANGVVATWNDAGARMAGAGAEQVVGRPLADLYPAEQRAEVDATLAAAAAGRGSAVEGWWVRPDGTRHCVRATLTALPGGGGGVAVVAEDADEQRRLRQQIEDEAVRDPLTGLANRARFLDHLRLSLAHLERQPGTVAVLFIDLDRTKVVNDSLGHHAGDELLVGVARRLQEALRASDSLARLGGDEFTILCPNVSDGARGALCLAERVLAVLRDPVEVEGRTIFVSASVGVALATSATHEPGDLLRDADSAMYRAKGAGGGRYELFDDAMRRDALRRLELEADIRRALDRGEFRLHFQPLARMADGGVDGVEALLRWEDPARGLRSPDAFLDVAEESGLVVPVGAWVLEEACRQAAEWAEGASHPLRVSVNVSPRQLAAGDLPSVLARAIRATRLDPSLLELEVTETAVMGDDEGTVSTLEALHALGVSLAIDDFGTGYSSLSHLRRFALDRLKIDRSFVAGLGRDPGDTAIAAAIIRMAGVLGLEVVAEGIEDAAQYDELRALGCDVGQGFLIGRPQDAAATWATIDAWRERVRSGGALCLPEG